MVQKSKKKCVCKGVKEKCQCKPIKNITKVNDITKISEKEFWDYLTNKAK